MATDLNAVLRNLISFYNFHAKNVIHVGAGGGQLIGYATDAHHVIAIDSDEYAAQKLAKKIEEANLEQKFTVLHQDFLTLDATGDVVLFEFCLHEINNPLDAIEHAQELADDILIIDHSPDSKWSWYIGETDKLKKSYQAIRAHRIRRESLKEAVQFFNNYDELASKVAGLGDEVLYRIKFLKSKTNFTIPMTYRLILI